MRSQADKKGLSMLAALALFVAAFAAAPASAQTVTLALSSTSITEGGGVATVTARQSMATSTPRIITVSAAPGTGAVAGDFMLSAGRTLTIAAGATTSTGTVTITANDNEVDVADKAVTVSGTVTGGNGVTTLANVTLTLTDDDTAGMTFNPSTIELTEQGAGKKVAVSLDTEPPGTDSDPGRAWISLYADEGLTVNGRGSPGGFTTGFTAQDWQTALTVTVAALDDADHEDETLYVRYAVSGYGPGNVADTVGTRATGVTVTVTDDDKPVVTLALSETAIGENGGMATVTATLNRTASAATTVTVGAAPGTNAVEADFGLSANKTLTIAAGATTSTGVVTVTANDNDTDAPNKQVTVSATVEGGDGATARAAVTLTLTDDDAAPGVTLALAAASIGENGGATSVSATLSHPSSAVTTVTVTAVSGFYTVGSDATVVIAAGATTAASDMAGIAAVNDDVHQGSAGRSTTVTATAANAQATAESETVAVTGVTLTLTDDETLPTVALALSASRIDETGAANVTTVTATLSGESSAAVTVTVGATPGAGTDFTLSAAKTLTIAAGSTTSTGTVTITASDDVTDSPDKAVTVSGTVTGGNGVVAPASQTLTITDDEVLPTVTLALSSTSITEENGVTTVTATLSGASSETVTVTVGATAGTGAVGADFDLSTAKTLTIAAGSTTSTGTVTVTANDNNTDALDKQVTVSGTVTGGNGVMAPADVTLTLEDDDEARVTLLLSDPVSGQPDTIKELASAPSGERMSTVTATLSIPSSAAVTITVSATTGTNAAADDFTLSMTNTLTIAAGQTTSTGTVTIEAEDDKIDSIVDDTVTGKKVVVSGAVASGAVVPTGPADVELLIWEDDLARLVTDPPFPRRCRRSPCPVWLSVDEGATDTFTVKLNSEPTKNISVQVKSSDGTEGLLSSGSSAAAASTTLTFTAVDWATAQTVTLHGVVDNVVDDHGDYTIRLDPASPDAPTDAYEVLGGTGVRPQTVRTTNVDVAGLDVSETAVTVTEGGTEQTFTVELTSKPSAAVTVTVTSGNDGEVQVAKSVGTDLTFAGSKTLTFTGTDWNRTQTVRVRAVDDDQDEPDGLSVTLTLDPGSSGDNHYNVLTNETVTVTKDDNDATPTVTLALSSTSITEENGVSTVTATLSGKSSQAVTVTVGATAGTGAVAADFTLSGTTLTIAAGSTTSAGTVTVTANGNAVHSPDKQVTVSGTVTGGHGLLSAPANRTLTLTDNEATPTVTLALAPPSISETGGVSTVTATLSGESGQAVTVTVGAMAGTGAVAADFTLSGTTLTIAAGSTTSTGTVTVTANGNDKDSPNKQVTVSGTVTGGHGLLSAPSNVTLTLTDDDPTPTVTLALAPTSISESGGVSTVTATLSGKSGQAVTVTVGATAGTGAVAGDFDLSTAKTLTIAAGSTTSAGTVTVTANPNVVDSPNKQVAVSGTVTGGHGLLMNPSDVTLTLTDDDPLPTVALALLPMSISESDGVSTVTASLSGASSEAVTVTVGAAAGTGAVAADFDLSTAKTLTIAAGSTTSAGTVTVRANGNVVDSLNKQVTVSGTVTGGNGVTPPSPLTLTLTDDETLPTVTLALAPTSISESGGVSTVTASLSGASSEAVTVTVGAAAGTGAVGADFNLSAAKTLTIAAGSTTSAGAVTVRANGNDVDSLNKQVTVSGTVTGGNNVAAPSNVTLTLEDDETLPTVTLALASPSITEENGVSAVTATLSGKSSEAVVVTVGATAGTEAVAADFDLSAAKTLTIAAGSTTSSGDVTVRANGNTVDSPDKEVTVSGTVTGGNGVLAPDNVTLTLTDNDDLPTATLTLSPATIDESGTPNVTTVTASLSHGSSEAVIVTVSVSPVTSTGAMTGDYTLSSPNTLTIAAKSTTSTGTVTVTAVDNMADEMDIQVTVSGSAAGGRRVANPTGQTLTIRDDEGPPLVTLVLSPATIDESGASNVTTVTARLNRPSGAATTVTVAAALGTNAVMGDYMLSAVRTLAIAAGATTSTGTVTVTANDNDTDAPNKQVTVSGTASNSQGIAGNPSNETLTIEDDDDAPDVTLSVASSPIPENGGSTTVSAVLSHPSSAGTTVTVTAVANAYSVASGAGATIVIAAGQTANASDTATITAVNNAVDAADNAVTVTGTAANAQAAAESQTVAVTGASLTITNDDQAGFTVLPSTSTSSRLQTTEPSGADTFTVTLATQPMGNVVFDVVSSDTTEGMVSPSSLTFTTTDWNTAQTVTLTGQDDNDADGNVDYTVALTVNQGSTADSIYDALSGVTVYAVNADDEYGLVVSSVTGTATEAGAAATFTVALRTQPTADVRVAVTSRDPSEGRASPAVLTFTTGNWNTERTVTATGVDDNIDDGNVAWNVRLDPSSSDTNYNTLPHEDVSVTTTDDDAAPTVTLGLMPMAIAENGETTAVRATLTRASGAVTTVTVTAMSGFYTVGTGAAGIIVIPAGQVANTADTATVTAVDDAVHQGTAGRTTTVTGTAANARATADSQTVTVTGATLLLTDDEAAPGATLTLSDASIPENGGTSVVSATLSGESAAATTVTVTPVAGAYTVVGADATIAIAAGATAAAADTVTITAADNATDEPNRTTTVTATLANSRGTGSVTGAMLTLEDNDDAPTVTLAVAAASIPENGGTTTVRATLSHPSSAETTVTVTALANVYTVASGAGATIIVAAGSTTSTDTATITAVDNNVNAADNAVTVAGMAQNTQGVGTVTGAALTITDDDTPGIAVAPAPSTSARLRTTESGDAATFTVTLATEPAGDVVLDVASLDTAEGIVAPASLTFTATTWNVAQTVTLTGQDDMPTATDPNPRAGNRPYTVTLRVNPGSTADNDYDALPVVTVYAENADNEYGLDVNPLTGLTTTEAGGTATFTVALRTQPTAAVQVTVASEDPSEGTASPGLLTFTPTNWNVKRTVTVTGVDDDVHDPDTGYTVVLKTASGDANYNGLDPERVAVTTTDDEVQPTVTLVLTPPTIAEGGTATTVATVTATLSGKSNEAVTVAVAATAVAPAVAADFKLSDETTLTIAAGATTSTGLVTVTAVDNAIDAPAEEDAKPVRVSATATGGHGVSAPGNVTLTITDDDTAGLVLAPTELALEEQPTGEDEATYTVRLATEPTAAVTVTVAAAAVGSSNADVVTVTSTTPLTFTPTDWATAQPVMVTTVAEDADNYRHDMVDLKHTVSSADGKYNSLSAADVRVTVTDKDTPPRLKAGPDLPTINGHTVRVTAQEADKTTAEVTVTPPSDLDGAIVVEIRPAEIDDENVEAIASEDTGPEGGSFSLGSGAARTVVDIRVWPSFSDRPLTEVLGEEGLEICLPVTEALRTEARRIGETTLYLLHKNGVWTVVGSGTIDDEEICAEELTDFSPFALAVRNLKPEFTVAGPTYTFTTGKAEDRSLPAATGGNPPLSYRLNPEPALPAGLSYTSRGSGDRHGGTITGTPTTPTAKQDYTLIARDANGDEVSLTFTIEVKSGIQSRDLGLVLAGIGRTLATDAVEILGGRFNSPPASRPQIILGGQVLRLTEAGKSGEGRVKSGGESGGPRVNPKAAGTRSWHQATGLVLSVARALGVALDIPSSSSNSPSPLEGEGRGEGSLFQGQGSPFRRTTTSSPFRLQPVSAKDLLARSAFELPLTRTGDDGVPALTLWGRGSAAGFAGQPEDGFKMDGTLYTGYLGLDYRHASMLMGLAVAHSQGEVSYERTGATKAGADVQLTSVLPYVHWQPYAGLGVWGLLGGGWGEMDLKLPGDPKTRSTHLNSWLAAMGGRQALTTWQGIDLAAKTDAFLTTVRSKGTAEVPEAQGHAQRVRLLMEGRMAAMELSPWSRMEPRLEVGGRWDSGTAEQGLGAEVGGGIAYTRTDLGMIVEAQGRYLLVHEEGAFEDWGASVNVRLDPDAVGEGMYLRVSPVWGQASSGVEQLWSPATALSQASGPARPAAGWRPQRLEIDLGYGLSLTDGRGLLTPYGGLALAGPGSSRYRLGTRLTLSSSLAVNLQAERAEQPGQKPAHSVSIRLGWQW